MTRWRTACRSCERRWTRCSGKADSSVPLLDGQQFIAGTDDWSIAKRADSINYTGPLYLVVYNVYSSAGAFLAYSFKNDQITSIGVPSDLPLGSGMDPFTFPLPNSHIRFRIGAMIDLDRPDSIDGLLGRAVEIPISVNDQDFLNYMSYTGDRNSEEFVCTVNLFTAAALRSEACIGVRGRSSASRRRNNCRLIPPSRKYHTHSKEWR